MGYSVMQTGIFIGIFSTVGAIGTYIGGVFSRKLTPYAIFAFSLILTSICGVLSLWFYNTQGAALTGLFFFFLTSFFVNLPSSINISIAQKENPEYKAMTAGIINGFSWGVIGLALSPIGFMIDKIGIIPVLIIISAILAGFGLLLIIKRQLSGNYPYF